MEEKKIVQNIRKLSSYIFDVYIQTEQQKFGFLQSNFKVYLKQLEIIYEKWFPKAKKIKDSEVVNRIYNDKIEEKDAKIWVKYSLHCLIEVSKMIFDNIKNYEKENDSEIVNELEVLREISFEAAIFLEISFDIMENKKIEFGHGKRFYITPFETFHASQQILRKQNNRNSIGNFVLGPSSIFLIRQSIELWIQKILGIIYVVDENNIPIKLQPERLFSLIDENIKLPIPKSVIIKIHKWTQLYVHGGKMTFTWEIVHAQKTISSIFYLRDIEINKDYYYSMEKRICKLLNNNKLKLIGSNPEVTLI